MRPSRSAAGALAALALALPVMAETNTDYFAVFMGPSKIGYATTQRQVEADKVTTTSTMMITIARSGISLTVSQAATHIETKDGKPLSFRTTVSMGPTGQGTSGRIDDSGVLHVTTTSGGKPVSRTMPWPKDALLSEGMRLASVAKGLAEGTTYSLTLFEATFLTPMVQKVRVGGTRNVDLLGRVVGLTEVTSVTTGQAGDIKTLTYVDKDCNALKSTTPFMGMDLSLVACSRGFALSPNQPTDFFDKVVLTSPVPLRGVAKARAATYTMRPTGQGELRFLADANQSVSRRADGTVVVTVRPVARAGKQRIGLTPTDDVDRGALRPTRFLESDRDEIRALAKKAVGDAREAVEAAQRLERFVGSYIRDKSLAVGYASAAEVAASREGDCSEHAVLLAALCRSVGIPAQVVVGVVYAEQFADRKDSFWPHAWVRIHVDGKWIGLDATRGACGPGHIAMAAGDGNPDDFLSLGETLGCFRIVKAEVGR